MYSFLFYANTTGNSNPNRYDKSEAIIREILPDLGCQIRVKKQTLEEINGGWFYFYPDEIKKPHFITDYCDPEVSILVWGDLVQDTDLSPAEIIATTWKQGGVSKVRELDGCFSAIIVDRHSKKIYLVSDVMGLRTFNFFKNNDSFLVSIHDVAFVSTGLCPIEYDQESIASLFACDWSIGGKSLLKPIQTCHPSEYIIWTDGQIERKNDSLLFSQERIEPGDIKKRNLHIDAMIEIMRDNAIRYCSNSSLVDMELTAGMDSRAVLGILLPLIGKDRLRSETGGSPKSVDVEMARRLGKKYGFQQNDYMPNPDTADYFLQFSSMLAFFSNGTANSKRAVYKLPVLRKEYRPTFIGNGGEVYHGYYYPSPLRKPSLSNYTVNNCANHLKGKLHNIKTLNWADPFIVDSIYQRLEKVLRSYSQMTTCAADIFNLFYLYERYGCWGSRALKMPWGINRYSLFDSAKLVKLSYQLPAPISQNCLLHRTIIKRYLPEAYHWPINKNNYMPMLDYPKISKASREAIKRLKKYNTAIKSGLGLDKKKDIDQATGDIFASQLGQTMKDILLSNDSLPGSIVHLDSIEKMIEMHVSGKKNYIHILGFMMTVQQWKKMIEKVYEKAR
ncbi:MAG: hypothetical protein K9M57_00025 [Phycisphaerae bacterium]|nr:hypothetical protein [Phycisphaerae bacterium]